MLPPVPRTSSNEWTPEIRAVTFWHKSFYDNAVHADARRRYPAGVDVRRRPSPCGEGYQRDRFPTSLTTRKLLARTNAKTRTAAAEFKGSMTAFSAEVRARASNENGLNGGMPFIWDALDPDYALYWSVM
ncbi:hypothetical protein F5B17DRAFT_51149 [Nemania serpens]|nr:hypothetical protein F5B17DRAFT_51149 [Nemania serpens]